MSPFEIKQTCATKTSKWNLKKPQRITIILTILVLILIVSSANAIGIAKAEPVSIFEDGFESGSFNSWDSTFESNGGTAQVVSENKYSGSYSAEFITNNNGGYEFVHTTKMIDAVTELYARAYINVDTDGLSENQDKLYFIRFNAGGSNVLFAGWRRSGSSIRWQLLIRDGSGYAYEYSDSTATTNEWYCIEAYWLKDGSNGKATLWINENQEINIENQDTNNYGDVTEVHFGVAEAYQLDSSKIHGDNFAISDEYMGPVEQETNSNVLEDDFESGTFEQWWTGTERTSGETVSVATYNPYQGNYHARFSSNGGRGTEHAYIYQTVNETKANATGYFNIIRGLPLDNQDDRFYLIMLRANGQYIAGVGIRRDSGVMKWMTFARDGTRWTWPAYTTSPQIEMNHWYKIELYWQQDSNQGKVEIHIDGEKIFEITNINTAYYGNVDTIQMGLVHAYSVQQNMIVYGDNFAITTETTDNNEEPPPDDEEPNPSEPTNNGPHFGWGGYITSQNDVIPILEDLEEGGYNAIRYWARPNWYYGSSSQNLDYNLLDLLVEEANERGITVYIDSEHNYPPSNFINSNNRDSWINDVITVGLRYNNYPNVVLEPINEYTGNDQVELFNWGMAQIRESGINLPLLWNFWWNQKNVALNDPDNNYAIGRHLYGQSLDNYNPSTPIALADAVQSSGIDDSMYRYFDDPRQTYYLQEVLKQNIPNGWVLTEMGPTFTEALVDNPSVGNIAYAMQFLREAATHNVSVICYRIGRFSTKTLYEQTAWDYFREDYFVPP